MTFDVDAWLDQAQPPTRAIRIYGRGDLVARLQALDLESGPAPAAELIDQRLGGNPAPAPSREAAALREQLEASVIVVTVRGYDPFRWKAMLRKHTIFDEDGQKSIDEPAFQAEMVADCVVEPPLTAAQASRLRERIGNAQWDALWAALQTAAEEPIDVPLSRLGSGTGQDS